jgi:acetyl-CoA carboxylase biotin carboxyl carrier protein
MSHGCKIEKMSGQMDKLGLTEMKVETSFLFGLFRKEIELSKQKTYSAPMSHPVMPSAPVHNSTLSNNETVPSAPANAARSPMVGVVYMSPEPGAEPFIKIGKPVKAGDTLCLIEAMKTFNPVKADKDGIVKEILITDGQAVEYDQPLVVVE